MDKPTTPGGPSAPNSPWPEDPGSEQGFGATGVFSTVKPPEPVKGVTPGSEADPLAALLRPPETARPQPVAPVTPAAPVAKPLAAPVVHKVVFGGGGAESSPELLERMRRASAERASSVEKAPAAEPAGKGNAGFTELLRTLGSDAPAPAPVAKPMPPPETPRPPQESGFTSLLRTLSTPEVKLPPAEAPAKTVQPACQPIPEEPLKAPAAPAPGGFTELLRAAPAAEPEFKAATTQPPAQWEPVPSSGAGGPVPESVESKPGAFTQLFDMSSGAAASPPVSAPPGRAPADAVPGSAGSFTRMLSLEQQSAPAPPPFREEHAPLPGSVDYGLTPGTVTPAAAASNPFSPPPPPEVQPMQTTPPGGGAGITRLIQMLDEPAQAPAPRVEAAPVSAPRGPEPGIWTQTFASLSNPPEVAAPATKAPDWTPTPPPPPASQFPAAREPEFQAGFNQPPVTPPPSASGPSEFTRILDASRIRELSMRGGTAAANPVPPPTPQPQSFAPVPPLNPPPMQVPNYPLPGSPPAPGMHGMPGMPQPGGFPPPPTQVPSYPSSYAPHAAAMPAAGGGMPQAPGMYAPVHPPMPAAPPVSPLKPIGPAPGMGKLQQYVPLLLVLVIVLLVAVLVTVIFLMKH